KRHDDEVAKPAALGAELLPVDNGLKLAHIYRSDPELPNERAPLARPGVDAREGDVLTAINGQPVRSLADVAAALANQAGKQVLLTFNRDGKALRTVATPVDSRSESGLRYGDWEEDRRQRVLASGKGRIGYLHLRAMGPDDIAAFARE